MRKDKSICVLGGTGFIGHHIARAYKKDGYYVRVVDIKPYEYGENDFADEIVIADLRVIDRVESSLRFQGSYSFYKKPFEDVRQFDLVFALCCNMGGAQFVFTGENDAAIIHDSALMNLHIAECLHAQKFTGKLFYSSSACMYPQEKQNVNTRDLAYNNRGNGIDVSLKESDAYPANPDSEYGWEKLFSERLYLAYARNHGLNVRIARFHNIYGPEGTYKGGKEKAPAAMCRKVAEANEGGSIQIWGDGEQTRSFLYIDDCIDAVRLLMNSDFKEPINIGSEEMIHISGLANIVMECSGKALSKEFIPGPVGVRGRNSNNDLIREVLGWEPKYTLKEGMTKLYNWIKSQYDGK